MQTHERLKTILDEIVETNQDKTEIFYSSKALTNNIVPLKSRIKTVNRYLSSTNANYKLIPHDETKVIITKNIH